MELVLLLPMTLRPVYLPRDDWRGGMGDYRCRGYRPILVLNVNKVE
jgi:hypothetical protein